MKQAKPRLSGKKIWIGFCLSIFLIAALYLLGKYPALAATKHDFCSLKFSNSKVIESVPVASTLAQQAKGLSGVDDVGNGMLFIFDKPGNLVFWMKGTRVPLSIAFISENREIVGIQDMEPFSEKFHFSGKQALMAFEVKQGQFAEIGVRVGDFLESVDCS